jgi:hypothetical protein
VSVREQAIATNVIDLHKRLAAAKSDSDRIS